MLLTTPQLQAMKAWIAANAPTMTEYEAAAALNALASPAFWGWRTSVQMDEIMRADGFDWTRVDNLSVGKARVWEWMSMTSVIDPSKANVRLGITTTWVGTAADLAVQAAVLTVCRRQSSVAEKLYATGTGSTASPAVFGPEGLVTPQNVIDALNS